MKQFIKTFPVNTDDKEVNEWVVAHNTDVKEMLVQEKFVNDPNDSTGVEVIGAHQVVVIIYTAESPILDGEV